MTVCGSIKKSFTSFLLINLLLIAPAAFADKPTVSDLSWMSGAWVGPAGPGVTLEENWIMPTGGSIASLVRMTGDGKTSMVEMIVIEEENDTLVLRIQQWDPGFTPRTPSAQTMSLTEIGETSVSFVSASEGGMKTLGYSKADDDSFNIDVETTDGAVFQLTLKAR
jgi:hypothetical protein